MIFYQHARQLSGGYSEQYSYDTLGRLAQQRLTLAAVSHDYDYNYDAFSRLQQITYPVSVTTAQGNRFAVAYGYDPAGTLAQVRNANDAAEVFWQATGMNAFGQYTTSVLGNGLTRVNSYDAATGRLQSLHSFASGSPALRDIRYTYSPNGNVLTRQDAVGGHQESFSYDALNRLTGYDLAKSMGSDSIDIWPVGSRRLRMQ